MYSKRFIVKLLILVGISNCYSFALGDVIDQRQTGEYNIRLSIKDVTFIAIDSDSALNDVLHVNDDAVYEDYDYNLDELTINPFVGLFAKPSTKPTTTEASTITTSKPNVNNIQEIIALQTTNKPETEPTTEPIKKITPPSTVEPDLVMIQESTAAPNILVIQNDTMAQEPAKIPKPDHNIQQHIPVQVVMEPINIPKRRNNNKQTNLKRYSNRPALEVVTADSIKEIEPDSDIVECTKGKYRDASGRCRRVRKTDGISQLIRLLLNNQKDETRGE